MEHTKSLYKTTLRKVLVTLASSSEPPFILLPILVFSYYYSRINPSSQILPYSHHRRQVHTCESWSFVLPICFSVKLSNALSSGASYCFFQWFYGSWFHFFSLSFFKFQLQEVLKLLNDVGRREGGEGVGSHFSWSRHEIQERLRDR